MLKYSTLDLPIRTLKLLYLEAALNEQRNSISECNIYVDSICYNFMYFTENENGSIFLAARGRF